MYYTHISFYFCNMLLSRIISLSKVAVDQTNNRIKNERIFFCWWKNTKKVSNFVQIYNHYFGSNWLIMIAANKKGNWNSGNKQNKNSGNLSRNSRFSLDVCCTTMWDSSICIQIMLRSWPNKTAKKWPIWTMF